jgi:large subunit ribosomal protein L25
MTAVATQLEVQLRDTTGKGSSRALRRAGRIPAVLYGGTETPVHFSLEPIQLDKEIHKKGFMSRIFEVPLEGKKEKVIARAVQFHPVTDRPLHLDFYRLQKGEKINVSIPITFINEADSPGLKKGGVLNIIVHNLEVLADMDHIPAGIEIDLAGLEIHDTVHLPSLNLPEGVVAAHPERDNDIANIVAPTVMKETEEEAPAEEGAEEGGAAPTEEGGEA